MAGTLSQLALMPPLIAFRPDDLGWSHRKAVLVTSAVLFPAARVPILGLTSGALAEIDFWAGTFGLAVVAVVDSNTSRVFVTRRGILREVGGTDADPKYFRTRPMVGGLNQANYQRHNANMRAEFARETAAELARLVEAEGASRVILAGDAVAIPLLQEALSPRVAALVKDVLRLDIRAPRDEVADACSRGQHLRDVVVLGLRKRRHRLPQHHHRAPSRRKDRAARLRQLPSAQARTADVRGKGNTASFTQAVLRALNV